ncbi:glucose-inhibited division family A protein [Prunus dulcis]|uniref:Glucose-inhibited division family A protein n=1 Tax=Prunus dulcis TaxID=3755 RepID=A0A4Y1REZ4_PRUDU|nr:glucose-inhibited division family A protein [Prunus dulcis]
MATTPALTVLHLSRLARHFPFSSSPLLTPLLFPCARLLPSRVTCPSAAVPSSPATSPAGSPLPPQPL